MTENLPGNPTGNKINNKYSFSSFEKIFLVVSVIFLLVLSIFFGFLYFKERNNKKAKTAVIVPSQVVVSGEINLNGAIPPGAMLAVAKKDFNGTIFEIVQSGITADDGAVWSWNNARSGSAYVFQAYLQVDGKNVAMSDSQVFVAPSDDEILTINTNYSPQKEQKTVLSGQIDLNGYIPPKGTISILGKKSSDNVYNTLISKIFAVDGAAWEWGEAQAGTSYDIQAQLVGSDGTIISKSQVLTATAPAYNENLRINSTAQPVSPQNVSISGKINFNGSVPSNSSISVAQRKSGEMQFSIFVAGLNIADGVTWSFNQAKAGVTYDFQAYLISNNNSISQSNIVAVAAPAVNEVLILNGTNLPPAPSAGSISYDCLGSNVVNNITQWQVRISYNNNSVIRNSQQFRLTVGTSSQGNQMVDITTNPRDPAHPEQGQSYTSGYIFTQGQTYYAQYAYSLCCGAFSGFSPSIQFSCNPFPTNTPAPVPTNTPVPQPTSTPLPTNTPQPQPTETPKVVGCNGSCGSTGYTCAGELVCIQVGGGLGGTVCRNPMCTDQTDCTCP